MNRSPSQRKSYRSTGRENKSWTSLTPEYANTRELLYKLASAGGIKSRSLPHAQAPLVSQGLSKADEYLVFPVFTYVVTVLVLSDSTLGKAIEDALSALYGTLQAVALSILVLNFNLLSVAGTKNMSLGVCLACMFSTSFIFTYFPKQRAVKKRLALAASTIIYVNAYIRPVTTHPVVFPLKLTVTITLGTLSAVTALIFPVPRLSSYQARHNAKLCLHLAVDQFTLLVEAFSRRNRREMLTSLWGKEKPKKFSRSFLYRLKRLGSQRSLQLHPPAVADVEELIGASLQRVCEVTRSCLQQNPSSSSGGGRPGRETLRSLESTAAACSGHLKEESRFRSLFYVFAAERFTEELLQLTSSKPAPSVISDTDNECTESQPSSCDSCRKNPDSPPPPPVTSPQNIFAVMKQKMMYVFSLFTDRENHISSIKVGLSMTLAVYLGLLYKKSLGYWSTITVALGMFNQTSGTFSATSYRLQGTALGTLYGYLVAVMTHRAVFSTALAMLPWLFFTSFMRRSKFLGLTGASSALTSALIILGKKMPGTVEAFAVIRMTEALIGLSTYLLVEAVVYPRRTPRRVREELQVNVTRIHECIQLVFELHEGNCSGCVKKRASQL